MTDSPARVAADVAALYPPDHPIARIARGRLEQEARTTMSTHMGTPLRDAAVDPRPGDFLPPVNAGAPGALGNPHGPGVVSIEVGSLAYDAAVAAMRAERGH